MCVIDLNDKYDPNDYYLYMGMAKPKAGSTS